MEIDWDNQPIGFPLWLEGIGEHSCWSGWYKKQGEIYKCMDGGQFREVRNGQFFIVHKKPADECEHSHGNAQGCPECGEEFAPAWNGEGLPPVGAVCENLFPRGDWVQVIIVAHDHLDGEDRAVFRLEHKQTDSYFGDTVDKFRPIRTAEQISAEERAAAIEDMWSVYWQPKPQTAKEALGLLWDAGYRKKPSE